MIEIARPVGWKATLNIWWEQMWRILLVNIMLHLLAKASAFLTPVIYNLIAYIATHNDTLTAVVCFTFELCVFLWATRESLTDNYSRFTLLVQYKHKDASAFSFDKYLTWSVFYEVWWAQLWRMLLVPSAVLIGSFAALMIAHPNAANYTHLIHPVFIELNTWSLLVFSLWGTWESLADRYKTFRFSTTPKNFYEDGSAP